VTASHSIGTETASHSLARAISSVRRADEEAGQGGALFALAASWSLLGLIIALLAFIVYMTFVPGLPTDGGWTFANWASLASPYFVTQVLPNTVFLGLGAITLAALFGVPIAWLLNRTNVPFRRGFISLMAIMVVMPGYVMAMGWIMLLDEHIGLINHAVAAVLQVPSVPLTVSNNLFGITWVMGLILVPPVFFLIAGPMHALDPSLQEAARMSGAGAWHTFRRIDLPLIWPSVLGALIYIFITAVSIFEVPALLGGASGKTPVLSTALFYAIRPAGPQTASFAYGVAGVYGLLLAVPCLLAMRFYLRMLDRSERYQVITGKGYRPHHVQLGGYRWLGFAVVVSYFALAFAFPFLVLVWASLLPVLQMPSIQMLSKLTFENYNGLLVMLGGPGVLHNTIMLVLTVTALVIFFSLMISWVVVRTKLRQRKLMDTLSMMPHAVPGLAFAFALTMIGLLAGAWIPWLPLSGTLAIIVIADLIQRLPYGTRLANAAFLQVHRELEEAAQMSGAGSAAAMRRILLPLIKPSIVYLAVWTGLLTLQEVSMALFLSGPHNLVLSVSIFQLWVDGNLGPAAAGTVVLTLIMAAVTSLILRAAGTTTLGAR
jgi:iron(III) transport system permease protein